MKILIIGNDKGLDNPDDYYGDYKTFITEALKQDDPHAAIEFTFLEDLVISVGDGEFAIHDSRSKQDLKAYGLLFIRGRGFREYFDALKAISTYAHLNGVHVINDYSTFRDGSKLQQAVQFAEAGLAVAKTVLATRAVYDEKAPLGLSFPCIMKATIAAHGNDNYVINSLEEARDIAKKTPNKSFVFQRFVPNDGDYRILIVGQGTLIIKRVAVSGSHLNNTSQGGSAAIAPEGEVPQAIIDGAILISKRLGVVFSGVDVLADKTTGEFYFLEVNSQPQLMTGAFIDEKRRLVRDYLHDLQAA